MLWRVGISYIGIEGTLRRARDIVYYLSKYVFCNRYRPEQCKERCKCLVLPWEETGVDLSVLERQLFMILELF